MLKNQLCTILMETTSSRVRVRFLTCSSPVDWGACGTDVENNLETKHTAMASWGFKEGEQGRKRRIAEWMPSAGRCLKPR